MDRDNLSKYEDIFDPDVYFNRVPFYSSNSAKCTEGFIFKKHAFKKIKIHMKYLAESAPLYIL